MDLRLSIAATCPILIPPKHHHPLWRPPRQTKATAAMATPSSSSSSLIENVGPHMGDDLVLLFHYIEYACKRIAALVASPYNSTLPKGMPLPSSTSDRDAPIPLDILSNEIILSSLKNSRKVAVMASEEDDTPVWISDDDPYVVVTDPLDGSRNIEASIPTGTIFGIYKRLVELDHLPKEDKALLNSLQAGTGGCWLCSLFITHQPLYSVPVLVPEHMHLRLNIQQEISFSRTQA